MANAKKIQSGLYEYKGWTIEAIEGIWHMTPAGSDFGVTDAANTKRDAMAMIDQWEA